MRIMKSSVLVFLVVSFTALAGDDRGQGVGNGGDPCEERFQEISRNLRTFVDNGGVSHLTLPSGETFESFTTKILNKLNPYLEKAADSKVVMGCSSVPVYAHGSEKTCVWRDPKVDLNITDGKIHIDCNFNRFLYGMTDPNQQLPLDLKLLEPFQYKQTIHEWASIAGLENNMESISDYFVTDQITNTGGWALMFKLGIKSTPEIRSSNGLNFKSITHNIDGSVTFTDLSVSRGDQVFLIAADWDSITGTCVALGFDGYLDGPNLNKIQQYGKFINSVFLNKNGNFKKIDVITDDLSKVTCFKATELKQVIDFEKNKNQDGSNTLKNIKVLRGDQVFSIAAELDSITGTCMALGFEVYLDGPNLNKAQRYGAFISSVFLNKNGNFKKIDVITDYLSKVTCLSGREPLLILIGGNIYRKILPVFM